MKKCVLTLLPGLALALTGCDHSYHQFSDKFTAEPVLTYRISTTGAFTELATLSVSDLKRELLAKKPNAKVTNFNLESMVLEIEKNPDNVANDIRILELLARESPFRINLIDQKNIDVSAAVIVANTKLLVPGGVEDLSKFLAEQFGKDNAGGFNTEIRVGMKGTTLPSGTKASLTLRVKLKYDIEYRYCEYLPNAVFGQGFEECN